MYIAVILHGSQLSKRGIWPAAANPRHSLLEIRPSQELLRKK